MHGRRDNQNLVTEPAEERWRMDPTEMHRGLQEDGFCIVPAVLTTDELERTRAALDYGVEIERETMGSTHIKSLDPNAGNIRINNLPAIDPVFIELLTRPDALAAVTAVLGQHFLMSNFTANIALPGSGSMRLHSDQALVVPPPWPHAWAMNVIWALDDVRGSNGATRYLPGSHKFRSPEEVPVDALEKTVPFEAPAGSFIAMEGRLWHTSGRNTETQGQRRMMFAYYASDFLRQQVNWGRTLPPAVQSGMDATTLKMFGIEARGNTRLGVELTNLGEAA